MKKFTVYTKDYLLPFLMIILLGIVFTIIIYLLINIIVDYDIFAEPSREKRLDGIIKIIGTSISLTGFLSIIITIIQSRKSIQREIQQNTIELFKEYNSEEFKNIRATAWGVMQKWYNEEGYREKFLNCNFNNDKTKGCKDLKNEIKSIYQLLEFYLIVSSYNSNVESLKNLRFFYYGWWRHFLYDITNEIEKNRKLNKDFYKFKSEYLESINYTKNLKKLDIICGLENVPRDFNIHLDGG